jgi:tetratricopeptide (TPR) repeat protein
LAVLITIVAAGVFVAGIIKSVLLSREPGVNPRCSNALMVALIGGMIGTISATWAVQLKGVPAIVIAVLGLIATLALVATGGSLAALGIAELKRKPPQFEHGFNQSVWAFVVGGIALLFVVVGAAIALMTEQSPAPLASAAPGERVDQGKVLQARNENFKFVFPGQPWQLLDPKKYAPGACLAMVQQNPDIVFQVIVAFPGADANISLQQAVDALKDNMNKTGTAVEWLEQTSKTVAGIPGYLLYNRASGGGDQRFTYVHWVAPSKGRVYQLTTWGLARDEKAVRLAAENLIEDFSELDPNNVLATAPAAPDGSMPVFTSPRNKYTVSLKPGWSSWNGVNTMVPYAEFGALNGTDTGFYTAAIRVENLQVSIDTLLPCAASAFNFVVAKDGISRFRNEQMEAAILKYSNVSQGLEYQHRLAVMRINDEFLVAHAFTTVKEKVPLIEDAVIKAISVAQDAGTGETQMTPAEQQVCGLVLNNLGIACMKDLNRPDAALQLFQRAMVLRPEEPAIPDNLALALLMVNRPDLALEALKYGLGKFPDNERLKARLVEVQKALAAGPTSGPSTMSSTMPTTMPQYISGPTSAPSTTAPAAQSRAPTTAPATMRAF